AALAGRLAARAELRADPRQLPGHARTAAVDRRRAVPLHPVRGRRGGAVRPRKRPARAARPCPFPGRAFAPPPDGRLTLPRPGAPARRAAAALAILAGLVLIARAIAHDAFRTADGFPAPAFGLPLAGGIALLVVGATVAGQWRRAGLWLALALAGQASLLQ